MLVSLGLPLFESQFPDLWNGDNDTTLPTGFY